MSFDDAVAALEGAVESETQSVAAEPTLFPPTPPEQAPVPSAPQGENQPSGVAPEAPAAPVAPVAPAAPVVDTFDGGQFNPDTLPEELKPAWSQLQAAFTRKTQDVAQQRAQLEQLGDINQITQAAQLYQQLQDPQNWPKFADEINQLMEANGIKAPAAPAAPSHLPQSPTPGSNSVLDELSEYPELAPLAQTLKSMQDELAQTRQEAQQARQVVEQREQQMRVEADQMAAIGEFQRQEGILRSQGLGDEDMNAIYTLAHANNGNLLAANEAYAAIKNDVLSRYLASKTAAAGNAAAHAPISGAGGTATVPVGVPKTLDEAHDVAMERLRAAGLDTVDF